MIGEVLVEKVYRDGTREAVETGKNMIMRKSKAKIISSLTWPDTQHSNLTDPINRIRFGDGGMDGPEPKVLTGLEDDLFNKHTSGYDKFAIYTNRTYVHPEATSITYGYTIDFGEMDGIDINEMCLKTVANTVFCMKTFNTISKDTTFALVVSWRIEIL